MEVFINLYHFDMPTYLFRRGGWESREVVEAYAHYAEQAFTEFAGEVKYWFTFNEPIVEPEQRYREGFLVSFRSGYRALDCYAVPHCAGAQPCYRCIPSPAKIRRYPGRC